MTSSVRPLHSIPKRRLSDIEKEVIMLRTELSRIRRDKADMILNKGVLMYFGFLAVAIIGLFKGYLDSTQLSLVILLGILALIIPVWSYTTTTSREEKEIEKLIEDLYS